VRRLGFESGVEKRFSQAKVFYALYTFLIVSGAGFVLIPEMPLFQGNCAGRRLAKWNLCCRSCCFNIAVADQ